MHGVKRTPKTAASSEARAARKAKEAAKLQAYLEVERTFFQHRRESRKDLAALHHTTTLLTLNPELYTVWNYRREILLALFAQPASDHDAPPPDVFAAMRIDATQADGGEEPRWRRNQQLLEDDLGLTEHALRAHPKVYWIWNHRMWCLTQYPPLPAAGKAATPTQTQAQAQAQWVWQRELRLVEKMLELDPRNFHGWNCRRAIVDHLALALVLSSSSSSLVEVSSAASLTALLTHPALVGADGESTAAVKAQLVRLAQTELAYATRKIESNFSNFSAWHLRSQLLPSVWTAEQLAPAQVEQRIQAELELVKQAMYTDPADQSVWFYHRWLLDRLTSPKPTARVADQAKLRKVLASEVEAIDELLELEPDSKWCAIGLAHLHTLLAEHDEPTARESHRNRAGELLELLVQLDPDRAQRYRDLLAGRAHF